ncbi:AraC family transcriptional regulator [Porticoccaceae bacterium]|nr:AraC family transcriptional regulator [Porticoccaceae bacterium]
MQKLTLRDFAARGFRATLKRLGINPIELIETAISQREPAANVTQPDPSPHTIHELIETAVAMSGDQELALRIGKGLDMTEYGTYGFAIMSSINMRAALELFLRYGQTFIDGAHWSRAQYKDGLIVRLHQDTGTDYQKRLVTELVFSNIHAFCRSLVAQPLEGLSVHFNYPRPACAAAYKNQWPIPLEFDQEYSQIFLPKRWQDQLTRTGNPTTHVLFRQQCEEIIEGMSNVKEVSANVRRLLILSAGQFLNIKEVSEQLHITERTLRRRLSAEGADFRTLFDSIRNTLAQRYLDNTSLSVVEIAHLLGYGEATNFHRAFQRWNGITPNEYRKHTVSSQH